MTVSRTRGQRGAGSRTSAEPPGFQGTGSRAPKAPIVKTFGAGAALEASAAVSSHW